MAKVGTQGETRNLYQQAYGSQSQHSTMDKCVSSYAALDSHLGLTAY